MGVGGDAVGGVIGERVRESWTAMGAWEVLAGCRRKGKKQENEPQRFI